MEKRDYTLADLPSVAKEILADYGTERVFALEGELGAGKTTLVSELCRQLGVTEPVSSPTFSIVNEYDGEQGPIYHLDCYRLEDTGEALSAGLEELLEAENATVFIEWPAVIEPLLPPGVVFLRLYHHPDGGGRRAISISTGNP